jgi:RecB family exonuclease
VAQQVVGMDGAAELLRDAARNLSGNVDRIVPDREQISTIQYQQNIIAQLQEQLQMLAGQMQMASEQGGTPAKMQSKNMLPDGSQVGGRESNMMSPRPNGV